MSPASTWNTTAHPSWNTPEHHGPAVNVVTWVLIVGVVLAVVSRLITRYAIIHTWRWDDITILVAAILAIAQSIAVSVQASNGLGSHANNLSTPETARYEKSAYAGLLLFVATVTLVKISVCLHFYSLTPVRPQRLACVAVAGFCAVFGLTSLLVVAFECKLPHPWVAENIDQCINPLMFGTYFGALNIVTDVALIALPVPMVLNLHLSKVKRAVIMACYATRVFVIAATVTQIYYIPRPLNTSTDLVYTLWIPVICGQVVVTSSIVSACFPLLKFLIDALETGLVRADARLGGTNKFSISADGQYYKAYGSKFRQGPAGGRCTASRNLSQVKNSDVLRMKSLHGAHEMPGKMENHMENVVTKGTKGEDGIESQSSQTHILRKVEWTLTENYPEQEREACFKG